MKETKIEKKNNFKTKNRSNQVIFLTVSNTNIIKRKSEVFSQYDVVNKHKEAPVQNQVFFLFFFF